MKRFVLFFSIALLLVAQPTLAAHAQTATPTTSIADMQQQYSQLLNSYRNSEEQFSIAAQQYYQLKTLASQRDAVTAARQVMLDRVDTLLIYIQILKTTLDTNPGIELTRKSALESQIALLTDMLNRHRARVEIATDRTTIEQEATFMDTQTPTILADCYEALSLIRIGAVQAAIDQLAISQDTLNTYIASAPISETVRTDKQRGSDQISSDLSTMHDTMTQVLAKYDQSIDHFDASSFHQIQTQLTPLFTLLNQNVEYIQELSR
ncbi:hypothetical protein C5B42_05790 [Candidatus Cerribacteria bacterium 'Amazon FNV 2010 28 9']|uniref:DUF5667 domain-containing protein n=1 Tax=Candidatus Cerribacteria bacterium 'Amazon FNV 2010 28 9' TaxID=2081795 RepID=A0A317JLN9_9BACT|nr:MAG: hypothetical protein C5B42_05790 [Candidatus Cerribacteria bacterium 'Amazon FNV 2010 28 9']